MGHLMVMLAASAGAVPTLQHVAAHFSEHFASVLGSIEAGQIRDWHTVRAEGGQHPPGSSTLLLSGAGQIQAHAEDMAASILTKVCNHALPFAACTALIALVAAVYFMSSALPVLSGCPQLRCPSCSLCCQGCTGRPLSRLVALSLFTAKPAAALKPLHPV